MHLQVRTLVRPATPALVGTWLAAAATGSHPRSPLPTASDGNVGWPWDVSQNQVVRLEGTVDYLGAAGRFTILASPEGRFVREIDATAGDRAWFDGKSGQFVDWNGMPGPLELYTLHWLQMQVALQTGLWQADGGPVLAGSRSPNADGTLTLPVRHRDGPLKATLTVDEATGAPRRLTYTGLRGVEEISFEHRHDFGGITLPSRMEHVIGGVVNAIYEIRAAELVTAASQTFRREYAPRNDTTFDLTRPAVIEVRRAQTGQVLVRPRVNSEDLGWFVLDTGGGVSLITPAAAARLHLARAGAMPVTSVWGTTQQPLRRLERLELGPVSMSNLLVAEMDLAFLEPHFGTRIAGLLGYDLFSRTVVEIELALNRVAVFDPERHIEDIDWQPLIIHGQHPVVRARFDRGEGRFRLDLGAAGGPAGNVLFTAPAVAELALLADRQVQRVQAGAGEVAVGAIDWFELAGHRFEQPAAVFHLDQTGPGADPYLVGNIGVSFMEPFRILFDYPRRRVGFLPR